MNKTEAEPLGSDEKCKQTNGGTTSIVAKSTTSPNLKIHNFSNLAGIDKTVLVRPKSLEREHA
jgi:hypothetical protein